MKLIKLPQVDCGMSPNDFRDSVRLSKVNVEYLTCLLTQLGADYLWPEVELHGGELFEALGLVRSITGAKGVVQFGCNDIRGHMLYDEDKYQLNDGHFIFHQIEIVAFDDRLFNKEWLKENLEIAFVNILQTDIPIVLPHVIWYTFNNEIYLVVDTIYSTKVQQFLHDLVENMFYN